MFKGVKIIKFDLNQKAVIEFPIFNNYISQHNCAFEVIYRSHFFKKIKLLIKKAIPKTIFEYFNRESYYNTDTDTVCSVQLCYCSVTYGTVEVKVMTAPATLPSLACFQGLVPPAKIHPPPVPPMEVQAEGPCPYSSPPSTETCLLLRTPRASCQIQTWTPSGSPSKV